MASACPAAKLTGVVSPPGNKALIRLRPARFPWFLVSERVCCSEIIFFLQEIWGWFSLRFWVTYLVGFVSSRRLEWKRYGVPSTAAALVVTIAFHSTLCSFRECWWSAQGHELCRCVFYGDGRKIQTKGKGEMKKSNCGWYRHVLIILHFDM